MDGEEVKKDEEVSKSDDEPKEVPAEEIKHKILSKESSGKMNFRENPWIISTLVLVVVLLGVIVFGSNTVKVTGNVVESDEAARNLVSFIESQDQGQVGDVNVVSSERDGELYKVVLGFQGQEVPVYVSLDGKFLIADVIPLDPSLLPQLPGGSPSPSGSSSGSPVEIEIGNSPVKGDENAPVTIVEFSDYQCPFCGKFYTETLSLIEKKYVDTGKVKLVFKDFPLNFHENAQKAAEAARCVGGQLGDEGYFEMHDILFENQQSLSVENYGKWAREIGVDGGEFDACLSEGKYASDVLDDLAYGQSVGVSGTPGFFINGQLLSGAQPFSVFEQLIEAELVIA